MLRIQVGEVDNPLMMKHAVAQVANCRPPCVEFGQVTLLARRMRHRVAGEKKSESRAGLMLVEKTGPETEVQFGDHPACRH